ncbi:hypothetical protein G6O69_11685 [Pseudenhygromyxa sp. WMMC2535]|uniref:hypothetical protein n=1 Tax=Pseudenhygromyxa sp. WMMC2535 TaxID=2712867 RepID=UPI0015549C3B|nr:hypothetical protein [Pseudenhygromyxa sp. WMMC2535]NVB38492.1 hypothetical protein [Pseudenhygromyxa sp. WMMC2535]
MTLLRPGASAPCDRGSQIRARGRLRAPRCLALLSLALSPLSSTGCAKTPPDCEYDSVERCLWERGRAKPDDPNASTAKVDDGSELTSQRRDASPLDRTVDDLIELMGVGLEWALIDERARAMCIEAPKRPPSPRRDEDEDEPPAAGEPWLCDPGEDLTINGNGLILEAGDGVIALTSTEVDEAGSAEVVEFALQRFDDWCARNFFEPVEGKIHEELYRCSLPEGPFLVVSRFPRDLDADRWQVSIAVMDAG